MEKIVKYYSKPRHRIGFTGINNVENYTGLKRSQVKKALANINTYVVHKEAKRPRVYNPFMIYKRRDLMQADLIDMRSLSQWNNDIKWILIVVDTFTRKCFYRILRTKTGDEVLNAFKKIVEETGPFNRLMTDAGSEFISSQFKSYLTSKSISFTRGNPHAPHVERLNRTIQSKLYKYMTFNETKQWTKGISDVVKGYNDRKHSTIQMSPNQADKIKNRAEVIKYLTLYYEKSLRKRRAPKYKVGDVVSLQKIKTVFAKGYEKVFTEELFKVKEVHSKLPIPQYTLTDWSGKEVLKGRFYENEMQLATYDVYKVERILDERTNPDSGETEVLVKWLGWPDRFNEWIPKENITRDYEKERKG